MCACMWKNKIEQTFVKKKRKKMVFIKVKYINGIISDSLFSNGKIQNTK